MLCITCTSVSMKTHDVTTSADSFDQYMVLNNVNTSEKQAKCEMEEQNVSFTCCTVGIVEPC